MIRVIVSGAAGRMGKSVTAKVNDAPDMQLVGKVDPMGNETMVQRLSDCKAEADVVIDFSYHEGTATLLDTAVERGLPVILCTTGHTAEELQKIREAAEKIPVFFSANMSLGVALLTRLVRLAARLFPGDAEIVETHHNRKIDAPSGTAKALAETIRRERPGSEIVCGRSGLMKRNANEIGVQSVRMGNITGIHEVFFGTDTETITLKHEAHDRGVFADGAIEAARFIVGKPAGLYDMEDYLGREEA